MHSHNNYFVYYLLQWNKSKSELNQMRLPHSTLFHFHFITFVFGSFFWNYWNQCVCRNTLISIPLISTSICYTNFSFISFIFYQLFIFLSVHQSQSNKLACFYFFKFTVFCALFFFIISFSEFISNFGFEYVINNVETRIPQIKSLFFTLSVMVD